MIYLFIYLNEQESFYTGIGLINITEFKSGVTGTTSVWTLVPDTCVISFRSLLEAKDSPHQDVCSLPTAVYLREETDPRKGGVAFPNFLFYPIFSNRKQRWTDAFFPSLSAGWWQCLFLGVGAVCVSSRDGVCVMWPTAQRVKEHIQSRGLDKVALACHSPATESHLQHRRKGRVCGGRGVIFSPKPQCLTSVFIFIFFSNSLPCTFSKYIQVWENNFLWKWYFNIAY